MFPFHTPSIQSVGLVGRRSWFIKICRWKKGVTRYDTPQFSSIVGGWDWHYEDETCNEWWTCMDGFIWQGAKVLVPPLFPTKKKSDVQMSTNENIANQTKSSRTWNWCSRSCTCKWTNVDKSKGRSNYSSKKQWEKAPECTSTHQCSMKDGW